MKCIRRLFVQLGALVFALPLAAAPVYYGSRAAFLDAVQLTITDDFSSYGAPLGGSVTLSDAAMSAVIGETRFQSISFGNLNLVGDVYAHSDGTAYCAGCNGGFKLFFDNTSLSGGSGGVFGLALDILFHTSRRSSLGNPLPGETGLPGNVLIEFADGATEAIAIPADVGYFGPETFLLAFTDTRGVRAISIGTEPVPQRHSWVIDNLTIAGSVPEPSTLPLIAIALLAVTIAIGSANRTQHAFRAVRRQ